MSKAYLQGRPRDAAPGKRPWRVRAYSPGLASHEDGRLQRAETGRLATRTPDDGQTLEQLFDLVERALGQNVALTRTSNARDLNALSDRYLEWLRGQGRDPDYIDNRRSLLNKWLLREHGDVPVVKWGPQLSLRVIAAARKSVGATAWRTSASPCPGCARQAGARTTTAFAGSLRTSTRWRASATARARPAAGGPPTSSAPQGRTRGPSSRPSRPPAPAPPGSGLSAGPSRWNSPASAD